MEVVDVKVASLRKGTAGGGARYDNLVEWMNDPVNLYIGRRGVVFVKNEGTGAKERVPKRDSVWANPFKVESPGDRTRCIERYRAYILARIANGDVDPAELKNRRLGCWCKPLPCHGDVLCEIVRSLQ